MMGRLPRNGAIATLLCMSSDFLTNHFLIAMPGLEDPNFHQTVTYICEHTANGAMGIVINRPLDVQVGEVFRHIGIEDVLDSEAEHPVYLGGPVQPDTGFIVHSPVGQWESTLRITEDLALTTSQDILRAMARGEGPEQSMLALGYAGWGAGQLEDEMAQNAWLAGPADSSILFDLEPKQRWAAAAQRLGVDLSLLSSDVGHA